MKQVRILGGGPAGACAAIAASQAGASVAIIERSKFPRHKVCGEFLSPEVAGILNELGVWDDFVALGPARIGRMVLTIGSSVKSGQLPETAWGCSRFALDNLLFGKARALGATPVAPGSQGAPQPCPAALSG